MLTVSLSCGGLLSLVKAKRESELRVEGNMESSKRFGSWPPLWLLQVELRTGGAIASDVRPSPELSCGRWKFGAG